MIYAFTTLTNEKLRKINEYKYDDNKGFKRIQTLVFVYIYIQYTGKNMADNYSIAHCVCTTIETYSCHCIVETELIQLG